MTFMDAGSWSDKAFTVTQWVTLRSTLPHYPF